MGGEGVKETKGLLIVNIKCSSSLSSPLQIEKIEKYFSFLSGYAGVGRFIFRHEQFTFCLMGRRQTCLNITGIRKIEEIQLAVDIFNSFFPQSQIEKSSLKIDSITARYRTSTHTVSNILSCKSKDFWVKTYSNFSSRINIRPQQHIGQSLGISANVFSSGVCMIFGAKNVSDLGNFADLIKYSAGKCQ